MFKKIIFAVFLFFLAFLTGWYFVFYRESEVQLSTETFSDKKPLYQSLDQTEKFIHPNLKFSFLYPKSFSITSYEEGEGEIILIQDKQSTGNSFELQIYVAVADQQLVLTKEAIERDLPDFHLQNEQKVRIDNQADGIVFINEGGSLNKTREIWFVQNDILYQLTSYPQFDTIIDTILSTWHFEK